MVHYFPTTNCHVSEKYYAIDIVDGKGTHYNSEWTLEQLTRHYGKSTTVKPEKPKGFLGSNLGLVLLLAKKEHGELPITVREDKDDIFITATSELSGPSDFHNIMAILGYGVENARPFRFAKNNIWYHAKFVEFGKETKCCVVPEYHGETYDLTEDDKQVVITNKSPKRGESMFTCLLSNKFRVCALNGIWVALKDNFILFLGDGTASTLIDESEFVRFPKIVIKNPANLRHTRAYRYENKTKTKALFAYNYEYQVDGFLVTGQQYEEAKNASDKEIALAILSYVWHDIFSFFVATEISFYETRGEFLVKTKRQTPDLVDITKGGVSGWKRYFKYYAPESKKHLFTIFENFGLLITAEEFKQYNDTKTTYSQDLQICESETST